KKKKKNLFSFFFFLFSFFFFLLFLFIILFIYLFLHLILIEQEITGDILLELSLQSLKELNISTFGKRFKIHSAILALREEIFRQDPFYLHPSKSCLSTTEDYHWMITGQGNPPQKYSLQKSSSSSEGTVTTDYTTNEITTRTNSSDSRGSYDTLDHSPYYPLDMMTYPIMDNGKPHGILSVNPSSSYDYHHQRHLQQSNENDDQVAPDMEGWLFKQGDKYKTWNKRWFVLKGSNLFYFKSPKDVRMKGIINLRGYRIICDETISVGHYSFKAQHEKERTFYFYADTDLSMKAWIQALIKATIARDFTAPVVSSSTIPTVSLDMARRMNPRPPSTILYLNSKSNHLPPTSTISTPPLMISAFSSMVTSTLSCSQNSLPSSPSSVPSQ
ncbi:uncharacterized protein BX664DRAFT_98970, partial [Halteromyces radiatus]|uniref:uncharacterized protein n=1 Tax=Halteromyces radiatus TaxID=101107 RepID=UPI0022201F85